MGRTLSTLIFALALAGCDSLGPEYDVIDGEITVIQPQADDFTFAGDATRIVVLLDEHDGNEGVEMVFTSDIDGELCVTDIDDDGLADCTFILSVGDHFLAVEAMFDEEVVADTAFPHNVVSPSGDLNDLDQDGFSVAEGDCDDNNANTYPGALELVDGLDNDCDGFVDEGIDTFDNDGDGYSEANGDCDDTEPARSPGAPEVEDGIDNDCDNLVDEGTPSFDDDGDGYAEVDGDCFDNSDLVFPGAPEIADGLDNDCDGTVDEGTVAYDDDGDGFSEAFGDCDDTNSAISPVAHEALDGIDNDCDGRIDEGTVAYDDDGDGYSENAGDCNDALNFVYPGAVERTDGVDNDCDGVIDELDGIYEGEVTVVVTGATVDVCSGSLSVDVDTGSALPVMGLGDCRVGLFEALSLTGNIAGTDAQGDASATIVGLAATTTWSGGFSGDDFGGTFAGSVSDGVDTYDFTAVFGASR